MFSAEGSGAKGWKSIHVTSNARRVVTPEICDI